MGAPWKKSPESMWIVRADLAFVEVDGEIAVEVIILEKEPLDVFTLVAEGECKFLEPIGGIHFQDMPQDRPPADLHHWLGFDLRFFAQPGAQTAAQNDNLHLPIFLTHPQTVGQSRGFFAGIALRAELATTAAGGVGAEPSGVARSESSCHLSAKGIRSLSLGEAGHVLHGFAPR